ncbi:MAG: hypothetical protein V4484_12705 [Pseudomonadota bacterium]
MKKLAPCAIALLFLTTIPVAAAPEKEVVVFRSAYWHVAQSMHAITNKKNCSAIYKDSLKIQATRNNFLVSFRGRGGVASYVLRIDDNPPDAIKLASDMEKKISAVILESSFERIYRASRVRLGVTTALGHSMGEDIDLKGLKESVDFIRDQCD